MGVCKYCGQSAGLLRSQHKNCETEYNNSRNQMVALTKEYIVDSKDFQHLSSQLNQISSTGFVPKTEI
jgi:hypothetical protein